MERLTGMRRAVALVTVCFLALAACGDDDVSVGTEGTTTTTPAPTIPTGGSEQERLDAARAKWEMTGIEDYTWSYRRSCFCVPLAVTAVVEHGVVISHELEADAAGGPTTTEEVEILTVDDLFDEVQRAIDTADKVTVAYDDDTGRVTTLDVDQITNAVDDEYGIAVTAFVG